MMAANMYRVGDYVFFETSATAPYQIRRIEELNKTPTGNVEAKVMCFFRRRDISSSLVHLADRHQNLNAIDDDSDEECGEGANGKSNCKINGDNDDNDDCDVENNVKDASKTTSNENKTLSENQHHQLRHRELFLSRQIETLPATHIRGKCTVSLLNETEALLSYLNKEDYFFYTFVYDPSQKTLLADRGDIRVGSQFQAEIQPLLKDGESDGREEVVLDELIWCPDRGLAEAQVEQFILVARSVGTLARALDCSSAIRQPSVVMSAAAASRDVTLFKALQLLHDCDYDIAKAMCALAPASGPLLCRDEMEEWSASEGNLFEEAMDKYGKDFHDLRNDFLPWKTQKAIVEYYYMWKTTDRYVQQKRIKAAEAERKLKQVYIPNYNKPNPAVLYNKPDANGRGCESCYATASNQWYAWGPPHMQCRLCANCWTYWKKYGGLKMPTRLEKVVAGQQSGTNGQRSHHCSVDGCDKEFRLRTQLLRHSQVTHGMVVSEAEMAAATAAATCAGAGATLIDSSLDDVVGRLGGMKNTKNNKAMLMSATLATRVARRLCSQLLGGTRHCALNPHVLIDSKAASNEFAERVSKYGAVEAHRLVTNSRMALRVLKPTLHKLGIDVLAPLPSILERLPDDQTRATKQLSYPADPVSLSNFFAALDEKSAAEAPSGIAKKMVVNGLLEAAPSVKMSNSQPPIMKKRGYELANGMDGGPVSKRLHTSLIRSAHQSSSVVTTNEAVTLPANSAANCLKPNNAATTVLGRPTGISNHVGSKASGLAVKHHLQVVNGTGQGGTPEDSYLLVTPQVKKARRIITVALLRRGARRPGRLLQLSAAARAAVAALMPMNQKSIIVGNGHGNGTNSSMSLSSKGFVSEKHASLSSSASNATTSTVPSCNSTPILVE